MPVIWRPRASADVVRIVKHISADNPVAAARVGRALRLAGDSLITLAERGRPGRVSGTRELLAIHPYIVVYRIEGDTTIILQIWHGAQNR